MRIYNEIVESVRDIAVKFRKYMQRKKKKSWVILQLWMSQNAMLWNETMILMWKARGKRVRDKHFSFAQDVNVNFMLNIIKKKKMRLALATSKKY